MKSKKICLLLLVFTLNSSILISCQTNLSNAPSLGSNISSSSNKKPYNRPLKASSNSSSISDSNSVTVPENAEEENNIPSKPQATATPATTEITTTTGTTSDIKERATFNGTVYNVNEKIMEGVKVTAKSIDLPENESWQEETATVNGAYVFRNAPVGTRIMITVEKDGSTITQIAVLKSNLQGDPDANKYDFGNNNTFFFFNPDELKKTTLTGKIFDKWGNPVKDAKVMAWKSGSNFRIETTTDENGNYVIENAPIGIEIIIDVKKDNKNRARSTTLLENKDNVLNFGGLSEEDKLFALASLKNDPAIAYGVNPFVETQTDHLSTFSVDVDTASYTLMRKSIQELNTLPKFASIRIEEFVNFFDYDYPQPNSNEAFSINTEVSQSLFPGKTKKVFRVGLQGKKINTDDRKPAILTLIVDTSGSMGEEEKFNQIKESLEILINNLKPEDKIGIVTYDREARVLFHHKSVSQKDEMLSALNSVVIGDATNSEAGIRLGYKLANEGFQKDYLNKIILCSDGVANTGIISPDEILTMVKEEKDKGISISTIGYGAREYNDYLLEKLADIGDGNYAYVDKSKEASRIFIENLTGTLQAIAKDVKVQVDFNPNVVKSYRLLGYENRAIADTDFRNNNIDAGEIGSNHSVTALYELEMVENFTGLTIADVYVRYKDVDEKDTPKEVKKTVSITDIKQNYAMTSSSFKLATSVALYAEILRKSYWSPDANFETVTSLLKETDANTKNSPKVQEFITIVKKAIDIDKKRAFGM